MEDRLLKPEEARKILGISKDTLIIWSKQGRFTEIRTSGNHRRYKLSEVDPEAYKREQEERNRDKRKICYCRVSTASQKEDLERQIQYFRDNYPSHEIISDIGSGINFKRKGFNSILDGAVSGTVGEVVVTHKDRLCRFGFDLIERLISKCSNGKIVVLNQKETSPEDELVGDLVSIITVFSSRLYGLRSHKLKKQIRDSAKNKGEEKEEEKTENSQE